MSVRIVPEFTPLFRSRFVHVRHESPPFVYYVTKLRVDPTWLPCSTPPRHHVTVTSLQAKLDAHHEFIITQSELSSHQVWPQNYCNPSECSPRTSALHQAWPQNYCTPSGLAPKLLYSIKCGPKTTVLHQVRPQNYCTQSVLTPKLLEFRLLLTKMQPIYFGSLYYVCDGLWLVRCLW